MQYFLCTNVDAITGVSVSQTPARNGPAMPAVPGLQFLFAQESAYPTSEPHFFCAAPAGTDLDVPGVLQLLGLPELDQARSQELQARKAQAVERVTAMRWARETGGIALQDMRIDTTLADQNRLTTVIANAQLAGLNSVDFKAASGWVTLTLQEVQAVAAAIAVHVQRCFSAERAHHQAIAACQDFDQLSALDLQAHWPADAAPSAH